MSTSISLRAFAALSFMFLRCVVGWVGLAGCGGEDLFVSANLDHDERCEYVADERHALARAEFDIAKGAFEGSDACDAPFLAHLLVHNENAESAVVESAEVRLMTLGRQTIVFNRAVPPLPNPFLLSVGSPVAASGRSVVAVEAIPNSHAVQLENFVGGEVLVELQLTGETSDGDAIGSNRFRFTVSICDGCRTLCADDPMADGAECSGRELGAASDFCLDDC